MNEGELAGSSRASKAACKPEFFDLVFIAQEANAPLCMSLRPPQCRSLLLLTVIAVGVMFIKDLYFLAQHSIDIFPFLNSFNSNKICFLVDL